MKMKKTQSLKLMLLGLMALVSGSAFAAVGDIFVSGDNAGGQLYYQQITAKGVKLIGVQTVGQGGNIIVPTKALNTWMNKNNDLDVIEIADNWSLATEVATQKVDANGNVLERYPQGKSKALTDYEGLITLTIEAEQLKTISTEALQPLNGKIKKFVVAGPDATATPEKKGAGLTAIPDYAFFRAKAIDPIENQAVRDAITALERQKALIDYTIDGTEGQSSTKLSDGSQIYLLQSPDGNHDPILDDNGNKIYVVKSLEANNDGYYSLINIADGKPVDGVLAKDSPLNNGNLVNENGNRVAVPCWGVILNGLQDKYDAAQTEINTINGAIGTLANNADYIAANNAYQTALQRKADADGAIALYALVSALWEQATPAVTTAVEEGNPNKAGLTANEKQLVTDILAAMANAVYTNEAGKQYRYSKTGAGYLRPSVQTMNAEQRDAEADVTTKENAIKNIKTDAGNFRMLNMFELEDALAAAKADQAAVEPYLNYWKGQRDGIAAQIKDKEDNELLVPQYAAETDLFGNVLNNEVLKVVHLYGPNLVGIGESAFQNCTEAVFGPKKGGPDSKIPLTTKTIGPRAFQNTIIDPVFDNLVDLESIGDFAFAQSGATTAVFTNATKLKSFGTNVFDDCALTSLLLKGTPLKAMPGNLAQGLKREYKKFVSACGDFYNYDVNNADDVNELKGKGFTDADLAPVAQGGKNGGQQLVNVSLKTASLPVAITEIPNETFAYCINLATLTDGIPAGVTKIGDYAFFATKISEFDLQALTKLATIGSGAFGGNKELTKVLLANTAPLTTLPEDAFECDSKLGTVTLPDDTKCLPAGLFADSNIQSLDLSKTQITVLPDLFFATEDNPNKTLKFIKLPETAYDENGVQTRPGLQIILDGALAHLTKLVGWEYETGKYRMEIPSSVWYMRPGVFEGDNSLTEVYAMDSQLRNLGAKTFNGCTSLKKFTFVTVNPIDPTWTQYGTTLPKEILGPCYDADLTMPNANFSFDDMLFFRCNEKSTTDDNVQVVVTEESMFALYGNNVKTYPMEYSTISIYPTTITLGSFGGSAYSSEYFSQDYGTWIKTTDATVYTAYQDLGKVYMYRAKHNNGYYKIPASQPNVEFAYNADGKYGFWYTEPTSQGQQQPVVTPPVFTESVYVVDGNGQPILDNNLNKQILPGLPVNYIYANDDVRRPWESAAVIIVSTNEVIPYERHTKPAEKYQSTLDRDNELRITGKPFDLTDLNPVYAWHFSGDTEDANFVKVNSGTAPAGVVVMKLSDYQGTAAPSRLEVVWVDDEVTSIMGVKEYVKSLNSSDVIYNLQGVRVKNTVKGQMYIQNGKKFIQK